MTNNTSTIEPLERLANVMDYELHGQTCLDASYTGLLEYFKETSWNSAVARDSWRQWMWQTCTEFGWYPSTDSNNQPFGQNLPIE